MEWNCYFHFVSLKSFHFLMWDKKNVDFKILLIEIGLICYQNFVITPEVVRSPCCKTLCRPTHFCFALIVLQKIHTIEFRSRTSTSLWTEQSRGRLVGVIIILKKTPNLFPSNTTVKSLKNKIFYASETFPVAQKYSTWVWIGISF